MARRVSYRHLALGVVLASALLAAPARAVAPPPGPLAMAVIDLGPNNVLSVTETVSQPGSGTYDLWPGAYSASVPAGLAALGKNQFTVPPGVQSAQVRFHVHFPQSGLTLQWPFPTHVGMLWLLVGKGLRFPVILNQKFYAAPSTVWDGSEYSVYSAKDVSGSVLVNLQPASPPVSPWRRILPWLWVVPVLLISFWIVRRVRWRRYA